MYLQNLSICTYCDDRMLICFIIAGFQKDALQVTFQPGQSHSNVCVAIMDDDIKEQSKTFRLILSIPYSVRTLGVWSSYPYYADVLVIGMYICIVVHSYVCVCKSACRWIIGRPRVLPLDLGN